MPESESSTPQHKHLFTPPLRETTHSSVGTIPGNEIFGKEDVFWENKTLQPHLFDNYKGPLKDLTARMIHVGVVDDKDSTRHYVMRLVAINNPYFKEEELKEGQEARTLYVMGGGLSDAVTGLGIAANMMDADQEHPDGNFRIKNVVLLSHPDDQPRTIEHTDPQGEKSSLTRSAHIVVKALEQTTGTSDVKPIQSPEHVMMIGHSTGGQMAIELAQAIHAEELILIEPTGIAELPRLSHEFGWGTIKAAFNETTRQGVSKYNLPKRLLRTSDTLLHSFTDAYGPYQGGWLGFARFAPLANKLPKAMRDKLQAGRRFGIPKPFLPAIPNPHSLDHDTTEKQRAQFEGTVTLVEELTAFVANALTSQGGFTKEELKEFDQVISSILEARDQSPRTKAVLSEQDLPSDIKERFYRRIAQEQTSLIARLFPNASLRRVILDQGLTHFSMLQDASFYNRLMSEIKSSVTE